MAPAAIERAANSTSVANGGVAASPQTMEKVFAMAQGDGERSYSKNSAVQAHVIEGMLFSELIEVLRVVRLPDQGPMVVADLGCSSGPNTIGCVAFIVEKLRARFRDAALTLPDFQAFFNDLPSNDFNNLFQLLSSDPRTLVGDESNFYVAGVPGTFFGRVFPRSSVNVFISFHSLHWLSKVPEAVLDKNSPAYNKGNIWINDANAATARAYKEQAALDLKAFLDARAAELAPGGVLFLSMNGRYRADPSTQCDDPWLTDLCAAQDENWSDLISQGILTEDQRDAFNVPMYLRTMEEVKEAVESCSSVFRLHGAACKLSQTQSLFAQALSGLEFSEFSKKVASFVQSVQEGLLTAHLGKKGNDVFWEHFEKVVERKLSSSVGAPLDNGEDSLTNENTNKVLVLSLIRI